MAWTVYEREIGGTDHLSELAKQIGQSGNGSQNCVSFAELRGSLLTRLFIPKEQSQLVILARNSSQFGSSDASHYFADFGQSRRPLMTNGKRLQLAVWCLVIACSLSLLFQTFLVYQAIKCISFHFKGKCNKQVTCPYIHDPSKIAVCTK